MEIVKDKKFEEMFEELEQSSEYMAELDFLAFTEKIISFMESKKITRADLARKMGCTPAYVTRMLRGSVNFTMLTMRKLVDAVGCDIDYNVSDKQQMPIDERDWLEEGSKYRKVVLGPHGTGIICEWVEVNDPQRVSTNANSKGKEHTNDQLAPAA